MVQILMVQTEPVLTNILIASLLDTCLAFSFTCLRLFSFVSSLVTNKFARAIQASRLRAG